MPLFPSTSYATIAGIALVFAAMAVLPEQRVTLAASAMSVAVIVLAARLCRRRSIAPDVETRRDAVAPCAASDFPENR